MIILGHPIDSRIKGGTQQSTPPKYNNPIARLMLFLSEIEVLWIVLRFVQFFPPSVTKE